MIVKFFKGNNNPQRTIDYLLGKNRDRQGARVIKYDEDLALQSAINLSLTNKSSYSCGCLSFEENNDYFTEQTKLEIIQQFEDSFLKNVNCDVVWIEHTDKKRLELNFFIVQKDNISNKKFTFYNHRQDKKLFQNFQSIINEKYNLTSPDDPSKSREIKKPFYTSKDSEQLRDYINNLVETFVFNEYNSIKSNHDIAEFLKSHGFEIARCTDKNISIKPPNQTGKNIRLKGDLYDNTKLRERIEEFKNEICRVPRPTKLFDTDKERTERLEKIRREFEHFVNVRSERFEKMFSTSKKTRKREEKNEVFNNITVDNTATYNNNGNEVNNNEENSYRRSFESLQNSRAIEQRTRTNLSDASCVLSSTRTKQFEINERLRRIEQKIRELHRILRDYVEHREHRDHREHREHRETDKPTSRPLNPRLF